MSGIIPRSVVKVFEQCELHAVRRRQQPETPEGRMYVSNLKLVGVTEVNQVLQLLEIANDARRVGPTTKNAQSSRSHSVFTLHLRGVDSTDDVVLNGELNLVDLAGSERLSRSETAGERLTETCAINKSLSCLADVFAAIRKASHVSLSAAVILFRSSKLPCLLQDSFSGDGKTMILANLSPTPEPAAENLSTLRFAKLVGASNGTGQTEATDQGAYDGCVG
ncbi:hypothetical protein BBJ28_00003073 [Nothophytophthora sp. Chile5]|nr:hypothetical protein BBJ28_00003073 [Nothophytophthora sp. Chile5]